MVDGIPGRHRELGRPVIGPVGGAAGSGTAYGNVTTPRQKNGGVRCPGSHIRKNSGSCLLKHCPVNGSWSVYGPWGKFSECLKTCGAGAQSRNRHRKCNNPKPQYGGRN